MAGVTVKSFLEALKHQMAKLTAEELQAAVLQLARGLEPMERPGFLAAFAPPRVLPGKAPGKKSIKGLLQEIRAFRKRVEDGEYADGWGWDDDLHDERLFGDESWADEASCFLALARGLLEEGEHEAARDVYQDVFAALQSGLDEALLPGEDPLELLGVDLEEETSRFLRAVYLAAEPKERPGDLVDGFRAAWQFASKTRLESMLGVSDEELPGLDAFGEEWISFLSGAEGGSPLSRLLHEAVRLFRGADGLAALARREGKGDPDAYVAWVAHLAAMGKVREAGDAALEALEAVPQGLWVRARLADLLRGVATTLGDAAALDRARHEAFRAGPTLTRLLCWIEGAGDGAERARRLGEAADRVEEIEKRSAGRRTPLEMHEDVLRSHAQPGLRFYVQLLRGEYGAVAEEVERAKPLGWSSPDHPGRLAVPFFLAAACGLGKPGALGPHLEALWGGAAEVPVLYFGEALRDEDRPKRSFARHVEETLGLCPLGEGEAERLFRQAEVSALARVDAIVSEKHRRSYDRAAGLLLAVADAHRCLGRKEEAERLVARFRERYPRHRAFLSELQAAAKLGVRRVH